MGMKLFSSSTDYCKSTITRPNPNKYRFNIKSIEKGELFDLLLIEYPDCITYKGNKLLMVKKDSFKIDNKELDPHFFEDGIVIARFVPTTLGLSLARGLINDR